MIVNYYDSISNQDSIAQFGPLIATELAMHLDPLLPSLGFKYFVQMPMTNT